MGLDSDPSKKKVSVWLDRDQADRLQRAAFDRNPASPSKSDVVSEALSLLLSDEAPPGRVTRRSLVSA